MNTMQQKRRGPVIATLIMAIGLIALTSGSAFAVLSAGTTISNQASVTYAESATAATSNTVNVTVNLVSGLAWIDTTLTPVTLTVGNVGAVSYTVDLHNTGNGTTTATISNGTSQVLASLSAGTWNIAPNAPVLVGTISSATGVYAAGPNTTTIPVSNLATGTLVVGTTRIMIGANTYIVAAGSTAAQLVVTGNAVADVGAAGVQMGEVRNITFSGTAGTLQGGDLDENHLHAMTATDNVGAGLNVDGNAAATDTVSSNGNNGAGTLWTTRVVAGALTVLKYSRNVTTPIVGATPITYGANTYYQTGVRGDSDPDGAGILTGDTLEYLVVISNAGPGSATDVTMTDTISSFLTLTSTTVDIDTDGNETFDALNAVNNNLATYAGSLLTVYAGAGGNAGTTTGGTITAAAAKSAIRYQATIQ